MGIDKWFEVDRAGLRKLLEQRGVAFVLHELVSNAWDAPGTTHVEVTLEPVAGAPRAQLHVVDDAPDGFTRLEHAWTLFAESERKGASDKRGRWNLGEKLVLSMCDSAEIVSTTGGVRFNGDGRHTMRKRRESGSSFSAVLRLTREQLAEIAGAAELLLPPSGVTVTYNGIELVAPAKVGQFTATLPTEVADGEDGVLRRARRQGLVEVYAAGPQGSWLYELGIPVVATELPWRVNVLQKVPLTLDRSNVSPALLRELRVALLAEMTKDIPEEHLSSPWVREACASPTAEPAAVGEVLRRRFGEDAVAYDPSDPEGSKLSVAAGRPVIYGGTLSSGEWENARLAGALPPAGQVTPSPRVLSSPDGVPPVPEDQWAVRWRERAAECKRLSVALMGFEVQVRIHRDRSVGGTAAAWYGGRTLTLHAGRLGGMWFELAFKEEAVLSLLLHEFAHEYEADHLSDNYHEACCKLGARLAKLAALTPALLADER